jgi:hypothetical protein
VRKMLMGVVVASVALVAGATPRVTLAEAPGDGLTSGSAHKGAVPRHAVSGTKTVHKATAKKATPVKHVATATGTAKAKPVAAAKHHSPPRHAVVSKPIPVSKHLPPAKLGASTEPVLPRV